MMHILETLVLTTISNYPVNSLPSNLSDLCFLRDFFMKLLTSALTCIMYPLKFSLDITGKYSNDTEKDNVPQ